MIRTIALPLLLVPLNALASPITALDDGPSTATINISASLNSSTGITVTGRTGDPFTGNAGDNTPNASANVSFGTVNLATGPTTPPQSTRHIIHTTDDSLTLVTEIDIESTLTGTSTGHVEIGGTGPAGVSSAHWACAVAGDVWDSGGTFQPNTILGTPTQCQSLTTAGVATTAADLVLHIPTTESGTSVTAQFNVTVVPGI